MIHDILKMQNNELLDYLEENKKNNEQAINIIEEINNRMEKKTLTFTTKNIQYLYIYLFLCNKLEETKTLEKLLLDEEFIKLLDKTDIDGSMLLSLTNNCQKPRQLLITKSQKLKSSIINGDNILNTEDIIDDLTKEEISIIRNDLDIDNYLITHGISFDTLKEETQKRLLEDIKVFSLYDIKAIVDFTNSYSDIKSLADNQEFINIYFSKLDNEYNYENKIFRYLNISIIDEMLSKYNSDYLILHLIKDATKDIQNHLLEMPKTKEILKQCNNDFILNKVPSKYILEILKQTENFFSTQNIKLLDRLNKTELHELFINNNNFYTDLLNEISNDTSIDLTKYIQSLPSPLFKNLSEDILPDLNITSIIKLLTINPIAFKKSILKNNKTCTNIINNTNYKEYNLLEELLKVGDFSSEEIITLINNCNSINDSKILVKLINKIPLSLRRNIYENDYLRKKLLKDETYELDDYTINYLLNHIEELKNMSVAAIISVIKNSSLHALDDFLDNETIARKIFTNNKALEELMTIIIKKEEFVSLLNKKHIIKYYTTENLQIIFKYLDIKEKNQLFNNDLIKQILNNDEELIKIFKTLHERNSYLLETLDFRFLCEEIKSLKISILEKISKYPQIQDSIVRIKKYFNYLPELINLLFNYYSYLDIQTINNILILLRDSCEGTNRKWIGNIPRMIKSLDKEVTTEDIKAIVNYLLYLIPNLYDSSEAVKRPVYLETPKSFNDIKMYEKNTEEYLTNLINTNKDNDTKEYFLAKHFKLSQHETKIILNSYVIERLDNEIYQEEYNYIDSLNKIYNTDNKSLKELDNDYKKYSISETYYMINKIKTMYGKIYNYEIRSKSYSSKVFTKNIYGKNIKIFECPNDFLFLISNMDISEEFDKSKSYFTAWHNTIKKLPNGISTSLISNDNLYLKDDITFGFNGLLDEGIIKMSPSNINSDLKDNTKYIYMTPRRLIDYTRVQNNTIILDRYAVRPNYNNSNLPVIEPDYVLCDKSKLEDNNYLEKVIRASEEFKTKRNKEGLPIIAIDINKISSSEMKKIKQMVNKYEKNNDMTIYASILNKIENNYTAYIQTNPKYAENFLFEPYYKILKERVSISNSIAELNYLLDTFQKEYSKYHGEGKEAVCNLNILEIKELITKRKEVINNLN